MHDFATGCWAATVFFVYWLEKIGSDLPDIQPLLKGIQKRFFFISLICIGVVFLTGFGRTVTYAYIGEVYGKESESLRKKMLIYKHIFLIGLFALGTYWEYLMIYK